jgi:hypothetical protein
MFPATAGAPERKERSGLTVNFVRPHKLRSKGTPCRSNFSKWNFLLFFSQRPAAFSLNAMMTIFFRRVFLKASFFAEIVRVSWVNDQTPAQNANKKIIQLTLQCLQETQKE